MRHLLHPHDCEGNQSALETNLKRFLLREFRKFPPVIFGDILSCHYICSVVVKALICSKLSYLNVCFYTRSSEPAKGDDDSTEQENSPLTMEDKVSYFLSRISCILIVKSNHFLISNASYFSGKFNWSSRPRRFAFYLISFCFRLEFIF